MTEDDMLQVSVKGVYVVRVREGFGAPTVLLEDSTGRIMPIYIGHPEALSINMVLNQETMPRPMTHDLMISILDRLETDVVNIFIDDKIENTYYARLVINRDGLSMDIDARPSDCIALALRSEASIYVKEDIFESVAIDKDSLQDIESLDTF
ncbi:bifunctional nuclease family protein [Methanohalobium sp.]|uniref:bifunctional nuclease family protein n=1 Tax=Methanohalobium sp. TaxID=2837493 RepID=UPI0025E676CE|nr:bifunctional nuclease family protein [Methanohalobium sp.]